MSAYFWAMIVTCLVVMFVFFVAGIGEPCTRLPWPSCLTHSGTMIYDFQGLLGGVLAFVAAIMVYAQGTSQLAAAQEQRRNEQVERTQQRRIESAGVLVTIHTHAGRMWGTLEQNDYEAFDDALKAAYASSEVLARFFSPYLANWINFHLHVAAQYKAALQTKSSNAAKHRKIAQAHVHFVQLYLDDREKLIDENGYVKPVVIVSREAFETAADAGISADKFGKMFVEP